MSTHNPPFRRRSTQTCLEAAFAVMALTVPLGGMMMPTTADAAIDGITVNGSAVDGTSDVYKGSDIYTSGTSGAIIWRGSAMSSGDTTNSNVVNVTSNITSGYSIIGGGTTVSGGSATANTVNLISSGGSAAYVSGTDYYVIGGAALSGGKAYANSVNMQAGTTVEGTIIGGAVVGTGSAYLNVVNISGAVGNVIGGVTDNGNAYANSVTVTGEDASAGGYVAGGQVKSSGTAASNVVTIDNSAIVEGAVYGGYVIQNGNAESNIVTINRGASAGGDVYGGYASVSGADNSAYTGSATNNSVNIGTSATSGLVGGNVYGGATVRGNATDNVVTVAGEGTEVTSNVYGGYVTWGDATGNRATIGHSAVIGENVYGGYVVSVGNATSNVVDVTGTGTLISGIVAGGWVEESESGDATYNTVNIANSAIVSGSAVFGGYTSAGNADYNSAIIAGSAQIEEGNVYGGYVLTSGGATGNYVSVEGAGTQVSGIVAGGRVEESGDAAYNTVNIGNSATVSGIVAGGYVATSGDVTGNQVRVKSGAVVKNHVYGGFTAEGDVIGNSAVIGSPAVSADSSATPPIVSAAATVGSVNSSVYGGYTSAGNATSNYVAVDGATSTVVSGSVAGGWVETSGTVTGNQVFINKGATVHGAVYGGYVDSGLENATATGNIVNIAGGTFKDNVYGALVSGGAGVTGNEVNITGGGTFNSGIFGGMASGSDQTADGNYVTIANGAAVLTVSESIIGGIAGSGGRATSNHVDIAHTGSGALVLSKIRGGYVDDVGGIATGNYVGIINSGLARFTVSEEIEGADAGNGGTATSNFVDIDNAGTSAFTVSGSIGGGEAGIGGTATDNFVRIDNTGSAITVYGNIVGGSVDDNGRATGNRVDLSGKVELKAATGESIGGVIGGRADMEEDAVTHSGQVSDNHVTLSGDGFSFANNGGYVIGGYVENGGSASYATSNTVTIEGGTFASSATIAGGYIEAGLSGSLATSNTVTIHDGTFTSARIFGGYAGTATNNTVILRGGTFTGAGLYGGQSTATGDALTGNTLEVHDYLGGTDGSKFSRISNFKRYGFYLPSVQTDAALQTDTLVLGNGLNDGDAGAEGSDFYLEIAGGGSVLKSGDTITLIDADTTTGFIDRDEVKVTQGLTMQYDIAITRGDPATYEGEDGNDVLARVTATGAREVAKTFAEGAAAVVALGVQGADMAAGEVLGAAATAAQGGGAGQSFGVIGGGKTRHKTGSHVDVSGVSLAVGVAAGVGNGATVGAFIEYGDGDYDTYNSFSTGKVKGGGDTEYVGVGFLGRYEFAGVASGLPYLEGTARFGRAKSDFKSADLNGANFDTKGNYHGLSLGGGHIWKISNGASFDLYGRYVWTHQAGDSVDIQSVENGRLISESMKFSAVDSHRVRVGGRYTQDWSRTNQFYVGAALEHEFDGETNAKTLGGKIQDAPEMKGSTGIAEFGVVFSPADNKNLSVDLGIQGYGGKRRGVTGGAQLKYKF